MMSVKRYFFTTFYDSAVSEEDKNGDWVKYEDYKQLQKDKAELVELVTLGAETYGAIEFIDYLNKHNSIGEDDGE